MTSKAEYLRYRAEINGIEDMTHDQVVMVAENLLREYDSLEDVHGWFRCQYGHRYCPQRTEEHLTRIMADSSHRPRDGHEAT